ncbi:MAG TPA: CBS domain-containing protein [Actinomycetota bacterium]|nr:CBS domain-containing protein [Actinomycetota bacterium]
MKISEIMHTSLTTAEAETSLGEAATLMGERGVGSVLIVDGETLLGILTERDLVRALSSEFDAPQRPVVEWMTKGPVTVTPDVDTREALRVMMDGGFRHLPVCDGDRLVGVISIRDLAGAIADA